MDTEKFVDKLFSSLGEWFPDVCADFNVPVVQSQSRTAPQQAPEHEHA